MHTIYMVYLIFAPIALILIAWIFYLEIRLKRFFKSGDGESMEEIIKSALKNIEKMQKNIETLQNETENHNEKLKSCLQKTWLIRFNPFRDAGSDQSFSLSLLDDQKNGFVLSSLYGRDINRIYAKPIKQGGSEYQLTNEEKEAISKAN